MRRQPPQTPRRACRKEPVEHGVVHTRAVFTLLLLARLKLIAEGHELVNLYENISLFCKRGEIYHKRFKSLILKPGCAVFMLTAQI